MGKKNYLNGWFFLLVSMKRKNIFTHVIMAIFILAYPVLSLGQAYVRINQVGYLPGESKLATVFSDKGKSR
jgi:hypothetical protein